MRNTTIHKYKVIHKMHRVLYDEHKMRSEEAAKIITKKFFFGTEKAVYRILNLDLPKEEVY